MIPANTDEQKGTVMLEEFMKTIGDFVFAEDIPEKADIIFIPGNGYPKWQNMQPDFTWKGMHRIYCQAESTAL